MHCASQNTECVRNHSSEGSWGLLKAHTNESSFWTFLLLLNRIAHCEKDLSWYCCHPLLLFPSSRPYHERLTLSTIFFYWKGQMLKAPLEPLLAFGSWCVPFPWVSYFATQNNPDKVLVTISLRKNWGLRRSHNLPEVIESVEGEGQMCSPAFFPCLCDFSVLVAPICKYLFI